MGQELYRKHRPRLFRDVIGQPGAVKTLENLLKDGFPHATCFSGPTGVGKTTLARILQRKLNCHDHEFVEINAATSRGIDMVRDIQEHINGAPMFGRCRIWYLDEVHRLTGDAMSGCLKVLEDPPNHAYFILATTEPKKILATVRGRCTEIVLSALSPESIAALIREVLKREQAKAPEAVIEKIAEVANGSARKALVLLQQVLGLETEQEQLNAVQSADTEKQAIDLCRILLKERVQWAEAAALLKDITGEPEEIRRSVLGYARSALLGGNRRAFYIITCFEANFFDSGAAGLARAAYEVFTQK